MRNQTQEKLAEKAGISPSMLSLIISGKRRPSWKVAKRLSKITGTKPELWLDGTPKAIKKTLNKT